MTTRTITCSICHEPGHNCRTCWMRNITLTRGGRFPGDLPTWDPEVEDLTAREPIELSDTPSPIHTPLTPPPAPKKKKNYKNSPSSKNLRPRRKSMQHLF